MTPSDMPAMLAAARGGCQADPSAMRSLLPSTTMFCPLWRRLAALLYDLLAVLALVMVVGLLCQLATHGRLVGGDPAHPHTAWWYQPLQGTVIAAYFLLSWLRGGQTLGMRPWRLRLTARDGTPLRLPRALLRLVLAALPGMLLWLAPAFGVAVALWSTLVGIVLCFAVVLIDPRRRTLHDLLAGTELRRMGG